MEWLATLRRSIFEAKVAITGPIMCRPSYRASLDNGVVNLFPFPFFSFMFIFFWGGSILLKNRRHSDFWTSQLMSHVFQLLKFWSTFLFLSEKTFLSSKRRGTNFWIFKGGEKKLFLKCDANEVTGRTWTIGSMRLIGNVLSIHAKDSDRVLFFSFFFECW